MDSFEDSNNREDEVWRNAVCMLVLMANLRKMDGVWYEWKLFLLQLEVLAQEALGNVTCPRDPRKLQAYERCVSILKMDLFIICPTAVQSWPSCSAP